MAVTVRSLLHADTSAAGARRLVKPIFSIVFWSHEIDLIAKAV